MNEEISEKELIQQYEARTGCTSAAQSGLPDGDYLGKKINDNYRYLLHFGELTEAKKKVWKLTSVNSLPTLEMKAISSLAFNSCLNHKSGLPADVTATKDFMNKPVGSNFRFTVKNGYTKVDLSPISDEQIAILLGEEIEA